MRGVIIDSQYTISAISNKLGSVIKDYCDTEIGKVADNVLPFRIETNDGNLAGYFTIQVTGATVSILQTQIRPAFLQFNTTISNIIATFITNGEWKRFYLQ
jgi:hypothetical protein